MAFLLGAESCIESLRSDLSDIQETIDDLISRIGYVKCYSWKYPDKIATDIKLNDILDRYKFGKDEVDNQVAHYSLLEVIIDRLVLLIHLSSFQVEKTLVANEPKSASKPPNGQTLTSNLSVGLSVKKYWSKLTHLCTTVRQLQCQNKTLSQKQKDLTDRPVSKISTTGSDSKHEGAISSEISNKSTQTVETAFVPCESCAKVQNHMKQNADIILNMCHFQNIPSYLSKFRSSLTNQTVGWLNAVDIERWLLEQDKDLTKISKQLEYLTKNGELLKEKLQDSENNMTKLVASEKELKKLLKDEQDIRQTTMKQYEKKLADQKNEYSLQIKGLEDEFNNLKQIKENLESQIMNLESINKENERIIQELNENNAVLAKENEVKISEKEKTLKLEQDKALINVELECLKREVNEKNKELSKERSKIENMIRHEQSLQLKQESLLKSMEEISQECENLKSQLESIEQDKDSFNSQHKDLLDKLKTKDDEIRKYENENRSLNSSINELKHNLTTLNTEVKKLKEKELLLLQYPDLYGPIPIQKDTDIIKDMELQIQANRYRIELLEQQNQTLKASMQRLVETEKLSSNTTQQQMSYNERKTTENTEKYNQNQYYSSQNTSNYNLNEQSMRPVPLFKLENEITDQPLNIKSTWSQYSSLPKNDHQIDHVDSENVFIKVNHTPKSGNHSFNTAQDFNYNNLSSLLEKKNDDSARNYRPQTNNYQKPESGRRNSITGSNISSHRVNDRDSYRRNVTPISPPVKDMEMVIGKGHRPNSATRPPSAMKPQNSTRTDLNSSKTKFYCERCNKTYNNRKDLDIHKLYCNR